MPKPRKIIQHQITHWLEFIIHVLINYPYIGSRFQIPLCTRVVQQKHVDYASITLKWHHTALSN